MTHKELRAAAAGLPDAELLRRVTALAGREREATVELVGHLAEFDLRKLHVAEGYGSLFTYCTGALRLAEHAAYNRIEAARLSRRFPEVLDLLADGSLNLSTVRLLAPHLGPDNFEAVVAQARGRSKREVEELVARLAPRPDVATSLRKRPCVPTVAQVVAATRGDECKIVGEGRALSGGPTLPTVPEHSIVPERPTHRPVIAPLAPGRYRLQVTIGSATHVKLRRAQDLLRREIPDGDPGAILDRALTLLLEDVARKKLAQTSKPREGRRKRPGSRHVSARVKRAVWLRDGGRCAFVAASGRRCRERVFLEFHHREPYAIGGEPTLANISLRCRAHNVYEAELAFGPATYDRARTNSPRGEFGPVSQSPNPCWGAGARKAPPPEAATATNQ